MTKYPLTRMMLKAIFALFVLLVVLAVVTSALS